MNARHENRENAVPQNGAANDVASDGSLALPKPIAVSGEASGKTPAGIPTFRQVVVALAIDPAIRPEVLATFKANGGNADRWQRRDVLAMADAITRAEDRLELGLRGRLTPLRLAFRAIRRRLEID
jgi:hypothetical protein